MARLMIIYDPNDRISGLPPDTLKHLGVKEAVLSLPEDLEISELEHTAKKLLALLIEQL